jgi:Mn2+/Fe2+ NRAMP family transporter
VILVGRLGSILFWSVIAAAFIGPGTVTTAASAGAGFGPRLLWALTFSTLACLLLQEASARLTVVSGRSLGEALADRYPRGVGRVLTLVLVLGAVVLGCAAYEAGNILGGVAGAALGIALPTAWLTLGCGALAALLLWWGSPAAVARTLSLFVAAMGIAFVATAFYLQPPLGAVVRGAVVPEAPAGSALLILALVGTTVVPYNLFLGSGLARGQSLPELRFGLTVAVLLGGGISMAVVVVGATVEGPFSFAALVAVLETRIGPWARYFFAGGLFAAGLSSAITAPLAAAITARDLFPSAAWGERSRPFRGVWLAVLAVGVGFGLSGVKPVPAIIAAQAFNGVLLPLVALYLFLAVNDRRLMGEARNGWLANLLLGSVVLVAWVLGARNVWLALAKLWP